MSEPPGRTEFGDLVGQTRALDAKHEEVKARLDVVDRQLQKFEVVQRRQGKDIEGQVVELRENTQATRRIEANTRELVEGWNALQGAMKVLEGIGRLAKPAAAIVSLFALVTGAWVAVKHWVWP